MLMIVNKPYKFGCNQGVSIHGNYEDWYFDVRWTFYAMKEIVFGHFES